MQFYENRHTFESLTLVNSFIVRIKLLLQIIKFGVRVKYNQPTKFFVLLFLLFLNACTSVPKSTLPLLKQELSHWQARGKILLDNKGDKNSGYFVWKQVGDDFSFSVNTFVGISIFSLKQQGGIATLEADGKTYKSNSAEQLVYNLTHMNIPVSQLNLWLLGEVPATSEDQQVNNKVETYGQIKSFEFNTLDKTVANNETWFVSFKSHKQVHHYTLPKLMDLKTSNKRIKIAISDWKIEG